MPGLFSRLKTWVSREVLTYSDLNAEFDNIISNCEADTLGGYSSTAAQMQLQVNPGTVGAESRPTNISGELERLRYVISRIVGKTYWYEAPTQSLSQANADLSWYFPCNGNSASDVINNFATRGCRGLTKTVGFDSNGVINWTACDIDAGSSAITSSNVVSYSGGTSKKYSLLNTGFIAVDGNSINANKGTLQIMFRNISAGDYLFHNKVLGLEVFANGSGNLVVRATSRAAASQTTKQTFTVTSATAVTGNVAFRQLFVDYVFNGAEGAGQDRLAFNLKSLSNTVVDSGSLTGQTITTNDDGLSDGIWYIGVRPQDPGAWTGYSAMLVRPDAETAPWTRSSLGGDTVTNGVLRLTNSGGFTAQYSKAISPSFGTGSTFEWKINLNSALETSGMEQGYGSGVFTVVLQDNAASRYFGIQCDRTSINVFTSPAGSAVMQVPINISGPTIFRATVSSGANPTLTLYVNGACVAQYVNSTVNAGANSISFTLAINPGISNASTDCEYFAYALGSLTVPLSSNISGNIDEACLFTARVSDSALISSLNSAPISDVLKKDKTLGLRAIALQQAQIPGYTGSALANANIVLGMILGDGQTDVCIHGNGLFSVNTLAAGSYRASYVYYNIGSNPLKYRIRDSIINEATSSYAMMNCRSMSGLSPVFIYSESSNTAYNVGFSYASNGLAISTNQNRE